MEMDSFNWPKAPTGLAIRDGLPSGRGLGFMGRCVCSCLCNSVCVCVLDWINLHLRIVFLNSSSMSTIQENILGC